LFILCSSLSLSAPPLYSQQNPKPPQMTICLWRAAIKRGEKRCCLDSCFAFPGIFLQDQGKKKGFRVLWVAD